MCVYIYNIRNLKLETGIIRGDAAIIVHMYK